MDLRGLLRPTIAANVGGGLLVTGYLLMTVRVERGVSPIGNLLVGLAVNVVAVAALLPVAIRRIRRRFEPELAWYFEHRPATDADRAAVLTQPFRLARAILPFWLVAAVLSTVFGIVDGEARRAAGSLTAVLLTALSASALTYFVAERYLRPFVAAALAGSPPDERATLDIRARLGLAWGLGSAIPILALTVSPIIHDRDAAFSLTVLIAFLGVSGLMAGSVMTVASARSIAEPLDGLRHAFDRVGAGDLDVEVPVDHAGEVGLLQAGFNQMRDGLRERERMADLFGRHVGPEVAKRALERGVELGGESLAAGALFVDVIGSTAMVEARSAEEVVALLNDLFAVIVDTVTEEGGWINKFEGDGALCVFGPPNDLSDHVERALRAARRLNEQVPVPVGIGVAAGDVVAGNVGARDRYEYTVIGRPVNEAARLSDAAKRGDGTALTSEPTLMQAGAEAGAWEPSGTVDLKGLGPTRTFTPRRGAG